MGRRRLRSRVPWGDCSNCAHSWAEHQLPDPCSECVFERDHGFRLAEAELCWAVRPAEPDGPADHRLDVYRSRYAKVFDGDKECGFLNTYVNTWWAPAGPWWKRRWTSPTELPAWRWTDGSEICADGIVSEENLDRQLTDWAHGRFAYNGGELRLEWLSAADADAVRRNRFLALQRRF